MNAQRVKGLMGAAILGSAAAALASFAAPAEAQVSDGAVLGIMRECAKIEDPTSRLACYDNNVRAGGATGQQPSVPGGGGRVQGGSAPIGPQGFGSSSIKDPDRFQSGESRGLGPDEIRARILDVREREPGIWLVTIEGGAQWIFSEAVPRSFRTPRKGALVEIQKASLGSFLMIVDGQAGVRVRRTK
ncbi:MAG: hypothetical protein H6R45_639 [Proteobacteria bacterium]|nr:hypothetical protein [Pseudomonadota bacterium]